MAVKTDRVIHWSDVPPFGNTYAMTVKQPLSVTHPDVAKQAVGWDPHDFVSGSGKRMLWECSKGHQWRSEIRVRAEGGFGCPVCANRVVLPGFNDLATTRPEWLDQVDGWNPTKTIAGTPKKLNWKCHLGHKWQASGDQRGRSGSGCPVCANQKVEIGYNDLETTNPSLAREASGWDATTVVEGSQKRLAWKCKAGHTWNATPWTRSKHKTGCPVCANKKVLKGFNDLATTHPNLAIEADGWDPATVIAGSHKSLDWKCEKSHKYQAVLHNRTGQGSGCPYCSGVKVLKGFNDLATTHPNLAIEADGWDPATVSAGSELKLKWRCKEGHPFTAIVYNHVARGDLCPICTFRTPLEGFNDLKSTHPELANEASGWDPAVVISGMRRKYLWECPNGHTYLTTITSRKRGTGCPNCANTGFSPDLKGWLYFLNHPHWQLLQIGITNFPDERLKTHKRLGWEVIEVRGPMDGLIAREWETSILQMLMRHGAKLAPKEVGGKFDGYTEAWINDSLPVTSLRRLMEMVREDEDLSG